MCRRIVADEMSVDELPDTVICNTQWPSNIQHTMTRVELGVLLKGSYTKYRNLIVIIIICLHQWCTTSGLWPTSGSRRAHHVQSYHKSALAQSSNFMTGLRALISWHLNDLNLKGQGKYLLDCHLSIKNKTEVVPTASRPRKFYWL